VILVQLRVVRDLPRAARERVRGVHGLCLCEGAPEPPLGVRRLLTVLAIREDKILSSSAVSGPGLCAQFSIQLVR
jgi:hypothetical protein